MLIAHVVCALAPMRRVLASGGQLWRGATKCRESQATWAGGPCHGRRFAVGAWALVLFPFS